MSKLKTLKDIKFFDDHDNQVAKEYNDSVKNDLKQEAIKWVKSYEKSFENPVCNEEQENKYLGAIRFIKSFFNIKEESLK